MLNFEVEAYAYGDESFDMKPTNLIPSKLNRSWTNYDSSIESVLQIFASSMSALHFFFVSQGSGGITVKKTGQALIIGIYDEPMTPGQCNLVVERLGDYLIEQGM